MSNFLSHITVGLFLYLGLYLTLPLTKAENLLKSCTFVASSFGGANGRAERNFVSSVLFVCTSVLSEGKKKVVHLDQCKVVHKCEDNPQDGNFGLVLSVFCQ